QPLARRARPLGDVVALGRRRTGSGGGLVGEPLQLGGRGATARGEALGLVRLARQRARERGGGLRPQREPLLRRGEREQAATGRVAAPAGLAERSLGSGALAAQPLQLGLGGAHRLPLPARELRLGRARALGGDRARLRRVARQRRQRERLLLERAQRLVVVARVGAGVLRELRRQPRPER